MSEMFPIKKRTKNRSSDLVLSSEQSYFVEKALEGRNILVDACIGSGKTTAIQHLCDHMADKKILYLTYNKLLKLDAKNKIKSKNTMVTNYHGFATWILLRNGKQFSYEDCIQQFLEAKPVIPKYDVLMIDEYQDIEQELADLLEYVKEKNPNIQIIAVGDMEQKIYDKTTLKVKDFITDFLDDYIEIEFTNCFRLSGEIAEMLGRVWKKKITGTNENCRVQTMTMDKVVRFLKDKEPKNILCLGARTGDMTKLLNKLESEDPERFNKKTVYASIRTSTPGATEPNAKAAVFTTFDSCKGMEKPISIVFDWTYDYWMARLNKPDQSYEILRNIFCVAASRGKDHIIFVTSSDEMLLDEETLGEPSEEIPYPDYYGIDDMFDFKYREDIDAAYGFLKVVQREIPLEETGTLELRDSDDLIDLLPCISIYQKASYFEGYDIDRDIEQFVMIKPDLKILGEDYKKVKGQMSLGEKVLFLTSLITGHNRYAKQVALPLLTSVEEERLHHRLSTMLNPDCSVQVPAEIDFCDDKEEHRFTAIGTSNVVEEDTVYNVDYFYSVSKVSCLVCACYMVGLGLDKGVIWNVYDNSIYDIRISNLQKFMDAVTKTITKGRLEKYYGESV